MDDTKIKEIVYQAVQATKGENSNLLRDLKSSVAILETHYVDIKETLDRHEVTRNGYVKWTLMWKLLAAIIGFAGFVYGIRVDSMNEQFDAQSLRIDGVVEQLNKHIEIQNKNELQTAEALGQIKSALQIR